MCSPSTKRLHRGVTTSWEEREGGSRGKGRHCLKSVKYWDVGVWRAADAVGSKVLAQVHEILAPGRRRTAGSNFGSSGQR